MDYRILSIFAPHQMRDDSSQACLVCSSVEHLVTDIPTKTAVLVEVKSHFNTCRCGHTAHHIHQEVFRLDQYGNSAEDQNDVLVKTALVREDTEE